MLERLNLAKPGGHQRSHGGYDSTLGPWLKAADFRRQLDIVPVGERMWRDYATWSSVGVLDLR